MSAITYSLKQEGEKALSPHFKVREFASKDGADAVKIDPALIVALEQLRAYLGASITIYSGYRTKEHNRRIGGSRTSKHMRGLAADIICRQNGRSLPSAEVCCAAQDLGLPGIAYIGPFSTHIDVRPSGRFWADERYGDKRVPNFYRYFTQSVPALTATVRYRDKGQNVRRLQAILEKVGLYHGTIDGSFGGGTRRAVRAFQSTSHLVPDGVAGPKTRAALDKVR